MKYTGRIATILLTLGIQTVFACYFYYRYHMFDTASWLGYIILFPIAWWTGLHYDRASFYSEKDVLTNLYNRRYVINYYNKISSKLQKSNGEIYLLVIDCDKFKKINDVYGHLKGDLVLSRMGHILLKSVSKKDIVSRWGGDEFLLIGRYSGQEELQTIIQSIEDRVALLSEEINVPVTASIGAAVHSGSMDLFDLIKIADENMYYIKKRKNAESIEENEKSRA